MYESTINKSEVLILYFALVVSALLRKKGAFFRPDKYTSLVMTPSITNLKYPTDQYPTRFKAHTPERENNGSENNFSIKRSHI